MFLGRGKRKEEDGEKGEEKGGGGVYISGREAGEKEKAAKSPVILFCPWLLDQLHQMYWEAGEKKRRFSVRHGRKGEGGGGKREGGEEGGGKREEREEGGGRRGGRREEGGEGGGRRDTYTYTVPC